MGSKPRPLFLRLSTSVIGFVLLIGHGRAPNCDADCGPRCKDLDHEASYFDVEGCWFDGLEVQHPNDICAVLVKLHPDGQAIYAGRRSRGTNPRRGFSFQEGRLNCEATSPDGESPATTIVCNDACPTPDEDLSCTGTLRLRDAPLGEPAGEAEIAECAMPSVDASVPEADASVPEADASVPEADASVADGSIETADAGTEASDATVEESDAGL